MVAGHSSNTEVARWQWYDFHQFALPEWYAVTRLREAVFVVEQACAYQDADGLDPEAVHLCGWVDGELAAYLRLLPPGLAVHPDIQNPADQKVMAIGRVVVAPDHRGRQLGRLLMQRGIEGARIRYPDAIVQVSAQAHLGGFYTSLGFETVTEDYLEDGIPHRGMHLTDDQ